MPSLKIKHIVPETTEHGTLTEIRDAILAAAKAAKERGVREKIEAVLPAGRYTLDAPLVFSKEENPELSYLDITLKAEHAGRAEISSHVCLDPTAFKPAKGKDYFTYKFKKQGRRGYPLFRELQLNYERLPMSKSPTWRNTDALTPEERRGEVTREGFYAPIDIARRLVSEPIGATELVLYISWVYAIFHVDSVDFEKTREVNGETYVLVRPRAGEVDKFCRVCSPHLNIGKSTCFFQNSPAFLTENTFAYDFYTGKLYLNPHDKEHMRLHRIEYPTLETLVEVHGVDSFTLDGICFVGTTSTYACRGMVFTYQAGGIALDPPSKEGDKSIRPREAALLASNLRGLTVKNCRFFALGGNGVQVVDKSIHTTVSDSTFDYISKSAVSIGNPSSNWNLEKNRTYAAEIRNNFFRHIAYEYPSCVCIYIGQVDGLKILHNTVEGCGYSAISAGWNWSPVSYELGEQVNIRDAEIAYNYFHNFMDLLLDGGAIYVVGSNCNRETRSDKFNRMHDNYAVLDDVGGAGQKYGYYLDGASSNWEMYHSVIVNCAIPVFSQPHPQALSFHNHIHDIYSTLPYAPSLHAPGRDVVIEDFHLVPEGEKALLAQNPEARKIKKGAGSTITL